MKTATYRRGDSGRFARAAMFGLLALAAALLHSREARAQWTQPDAAGNTSTTGAGNVGIGTPSPDTHAKLHVYNAQSAGVDIQSATGGSWSRLRLMTGTRAYGWFTGDSSNTDAANKIGLYDYTANAFRMMVDSSGNVGIGTSSPGRKLEVLAPDGDAARLYRNAANAGWGVNIVFAFNNSSNVRKDYAGVHGILANPAAGAEAGNLIFTTTTGGSLTEKMRIDHAGNVGVGTASPDTHAKLHVYNAPSAGLDVQSENGGGWSRLRLMTGTHAYGWFTGDSSNTEAANKIGLYDYTVGAFRMMVDSSGNVGVGTAAPAVKLDVNGDIRASGNISAKYQDLAEWVPSTQKLSAGTVVVLDTRNSNHVLASTTAYDTRVAGVISAQPGISLGEAGEGKTLVATTGRVKVKVDATRAPILIGDLIVTSDVAGVAMKSEPIPLAGRQIHAPGTIIGKALEPLEKGTGEILVLLSLQ